MTDDDRNAAERDSRTGLEQVDALARGEYETSPMTRLVPFKTLPPRKGLLTFEATPDKTHLNGFGVVHGGWVMTMLDNAMGLAAHSMVDEGEFCPSIETSVRFLKKIEADGQVLTVIAKVIGREGRKFMVEGVIEAANGAKLATGTSTCFLMQAEG